MIPVEAVEAAAGVIALGEMEKTRYLKVARAALEAAAPFIAAEGFQRGYLAAMEEAAK